MTPRRLVLRDWEAAVWHAGRLSAVVRAVKSDWPEWFEDPFEIEPGQWYVCDNRPPDISKNYPIRCPLGAPGQPLWIAESWARKVVTAGRPGLVYRDDGGTEPPLGFGSWRSPMTMPQWASRSTAVHLGSRIVRVQEITEEDAWALGCEPGELDDYGRPFPAERQISQTCWEGWDCAKDWFADLFEEIHGQSAWDRNDWVWIHRIGRGDA